MVAIIFSLTLEWNIQILCFKLSFLHKARCKILTFHHLFFRKTFVIEEKMQKPEIQEACITKHKKYIVETNLAYNSWLLGSVNFLRIDKIGKIHYILEIVRQIKKVI